MTLERLIEEVGNGGSHSTSFGGSVGCRPHERGPTAILTYEAAGSATGLGRIVGLDVDLERVTRAYLAGRVDRGLREAVRDRVMSGMG